MKNVRMTICLMLAVLFMATGQGFGNIYFNDGGIHNIDYAIAEYVYVENHTTVNVLDGGSLSIITIYDNSQVTMTGGHVVVLSARDSSQVTMSGGQVSELTATNGSQVTMSGGSINSNLTAAGSSHITMSGGSVSSNLIAWESGQITMSGGSVGLYLFANDSSQVTMLGGTIENKIILTGGTILTIVGSNFAIDGTPFSSGEITSILGGSYEYESHRTLTGTLAKGDIINNQFQIGNTAKIVISPVCSEPISGDLNGDCKVDFEDFAIMASHWLQKSYVIIAKFALDTNPDWTTQGQWQFGTPMGMGGLSYGHPDPIVAYSGLNVYGVNLDGDYTVAVGGPYRLTAGPFDCNSYAAVKLSFAEWLNTDSADYVQCKVEASNDGSTWQTVWLNPTTEPITDYYWRVVQYDISEIAAGHSQVYIRWSYQIISDRAYPYSGWNIDDVELRGLSN